MRVVAEVGTATRTQKNDLRLGTRQVNREVQIERTIHRKFMEDRRNRKTIAGYDSSYPAIWVKGLLEAEAQTDLHDAGCALNRVEVRPVCRWR